MANRHKLELEQVAVYVMCGGGLVGRRAAEQPADFYRDARCSRPPYPDKVIMEAVKVLVALAEEAGLDPHDMPKMPRFHNFGYF